MSESAPTAAPAPVGPRIPWLRMALLHHGAGFLVGFVVPLVLFAGEIAAIGLGAISGLVIVIGAAFPAFIGAVAGQRIASGGARTLRADLLGVALGALAGGLVTLLIFAAIFGFAGDTPWWLGAVVGVATAVGLGAQVVAAWRTAARPTSG